MCYVSMPRVPPDQFYSINNICRGVLTMKCTLLNFLQNSALASFLGTNISISTLHPSIPNIPQNLSPFWFYLIFQITYSKTKLKNNGSHEL